MIQNANFSNMPWCINFCIYSKMNILDKWNKTGELDLFLKSIFLCFGLFSGHINNKIINDLYLSTILELIWFNNSIRKRCMICQRTWKNIKFSYFILLLVFQWIFFSFEVINYIFCDLLLLWSVYRIYIETADTEPPDSTPLIWMSINNIHKCVPYKTHQVLTEPNLIALLGDV